MEAISTNEFAENREELTRIIDSVLTQAKTMGASAAEADVGVGSGLSANVRKGEIDKLEYERDKGLGITVYINGQKGNSSTSDFSEDAIKKSIEAAIGIAKHASRDEFAGLADAELMATEFPDLNLYHPWTIAPEAAIELAIECEQSAFDADKRISNSDGTSVSTYSGLNLYGNTNNFINGWSWSSHTIDCTVIAEDSNGMQRDGWYSKARDFNDLQSIKDISQEAARRTVVRLGSRKLKTCKAPVIFEAPIASGLFSALITAIAGGSLYRRATFLLDKKGEQIFSDHINIYEQPYIMKALGSAPFDNDGVTTKERDIVKDGMLMDYVLSAYSARKLGLQTTGNAGGVHNLVIEPGTDSLDDLVKKMDTGLLITDMIGFGVNQITGDYSRGASGFWVENGELAYPVEEITVAGNLADMYKNIISIANDVDPRGNVLTGSVLMDTMTIAGE
ncbi:MAG TPA: metalloprotease PmbA [Thiotrichaceae bacterium]|jgi:PmbA protein|nr:metalloprotease PmbA [Thiotrichaceae bacterium]HIM07116.1 metalloprotease PmbA [Gammaproteobacteria bacterium]